MRVPARQCVHCGQEVAPEQTWICNHCGKLFAGEAAEQAVREQSEAARETDEREAALRREEMLDPETAKAQAAEQAPLAERLSGDLGGVGRTSEGETPGAPEPVEDELDPQVEAKASGVGVRAFATPFRYRAYEADELRYGWSVGPDPEGRYHSVTLHRQHDGAWHPTADVECATAGDAEAWALRQFMGGQRGVNLGLRPVTQGGEPARIQQDPGSTERS